MRLGLSWTRWTLALGLAGCPAGDDSGDSTDTTATGASSADDGGDGSGADDGGGSTAAEGSGGSGGTNADDTAGGSTGGVMCEYVDPGEAGCPKGTAQCNDVGPTFNCVAVELVDACCGCELPDCPG